MAATQGGQDVYATLLTNDTYLPGALVLAHSLRDSGTTKQLAALVTLDTVSADAIAQLRTIFDHVIPVPRIRNTASPDNLDLMKRPDLHSAFTKINLWKMGQFRKIVFLDADVVAYRAPDELFDLSCTFAAAPDIGWPDLFNTGVMVITPDLGEYHTLLAMAQQGTSFDGADQGLLNIHYRDTWHRLPFTYNVTPSAHYQYLPAYRHFQSEIAMVHFIGSEKPWKQGRGASTGSPAYDEMVGRWWSVYDQHYHPQSQPPPPEIVQYFVKGEFQPTITFTLTGDEPSFGLGSSSYDQVQGHSAGTSQPPAEEKSTEPYRPPMEPAWDAQWQPPPVNAKPEALNFPQAHYEMSHDTTPFIPPERYPSPPRNMWYEVPRATPTPTYQRPPPIFPWETHQTTATRVFAEPTPQGTEPSEEESGQSGPYPEHMHQAPGAEPYMTADSPSVDLRTEPTTPVMPSADRHYPPSDPWASYTRTNAWDDVPQIERYVDSFQKQHRRVWSRGQAPGSLQLGSLDGNFAKTGSGDDGGWRGSKVTDFPSEAERPSLPVTPAPIRRPKSWGSGGPGSGVDGGAGGGDHLLPAAEGVPQQSDWDPVAQLEKLAKEQSEMLLKRLGAETRTDIDSEETRAYVARPAARVVSPRPVKPGGLETSSVRSIGNGHSDDAANLVALETTIAEPSYQGPGVMFEKDEGFPMTDMAVALPSEEEMDVLDT